MKIIVKHIIVFLIIIASMFLFGCGFVEKEADSRGVIQTAAEAEKEPEDSVESAEIIETAENADANVTAAAVSESNDTQNAAENSENHANDKPQDKENEERIKSYLQYIAHCAKDWGYDEPFSYSDLETYHYFSENCDYSSIYDLAYLFYPENGMYFENVVSVNMQKCISVLITKPDLIITDYFEEIQNVCSSELKHYDFAPFNYSYYKDGYYEIEYFDNIIRFIPYSDGVQNKLHIQVSKAGAEIPQSQIIGTELALKNVSFSFPESTIPYVSPSFLKENLIYGLHTLVGEDYNELISQGIISDGGVRSKIHYYFYRNMEISLCCTDNRIDYVRVNIDDITTKHSKDYSDIKATFPGGFQYASFRDAKWFYGFEGFFVKLNDIELVLPGGREALEGLAIIY